MPLRSFHLLAASAGLLAAACAAQAQTQAPLPAMHGEGAVRWACGGIGSDESTAMRAAMASHPLSLLFARADGAYLASVDVQIQGAASARLRAGGPVCLIDLPAGKYTVQATLEGVTRSQSVTVGGGPRTLDFRF
ncbi:carboxypeptidase regulatory-like domain-containing protein [Xenophilus sp.]|uniref:carboxypeptidase regulatory-like domain-containing protein n=1 Tax=Xenophilus sp. TaxID=1873499 RepID=UPI0037DDA35A